MRYLPIALTALALSGAAPSAQAPVDLKAQQLLFPVIDDGDDQYGWDAAMDGDWLLIGARVDKGSVGTAAGRGYLYQWTGTEWSLHQLLTPSDIAPFAFYGAGTAIEGDLLAISATDTFVSGTPLGTVAVYRLQGSTWVEEDLLLPPPIGFANTELGGQGLEISGDTIAAGASWYNGFSGAVGVWRFVAGSWTIEAWILPPPSAGGEFGIDVALDGDVMVVTTDPTPGSGPAFVYRRSGTVWNLEQQLNYPAGTFPGTVGFGKGADVDGNTIALGASWGGGSALVLTYEWNGSAWVPDQSLPGFAGAGNDDFGIAIELDGDLLLVGSSAPDGGAYLYVREAGVWVPWAHLDPLGTQGVPQNPSGFGMAVAMADGRAVAAHPLYDHPGFDRGAAVAFEIPMPGGPSLIGDAREASLSLGGTQELGLFAGSSHAGELHFLLGSSSGTAPGLPLGGLVLPLNPDPYFSLTLAMPGVPPVVHSFAALDAAGASWARFELPPGTSPALAGVTVHHAFLAIDGVPSVTFTSNAEDVLLVP